VLLPGKRQFGFLISSAVGVWALFNTTRVRPGCIRDTHSSLAVTIASQPITRLASPIAIRVAWMSDGRVAICTWLITAPPFCARPVTSSTVTPLFSRCAAMPSSAPIVTTPVPPTPVTSTPYGRTIDGSSGSGTGGIASPTMPEAAFGLRN
jgi:hypothetical protein